MLAETRLAAAAMGRSTTFVDAGRHDAWPDFIVGKGSDFKQFIQKVAPVHVLWDICTVISPDIVLVPNAYPCQ
jgi:hypothetical protein